MFSIRMRVLVEYTDDDDDDDDDDNDDDGVYPSHEGIYFSV